MACISGIFGPIVHANIKGENVGMYEVARVGHQRLWGEVVSIDRDTAAIQVYEDTEGLRLGEPVEFTRNMLSAELGPGLIGSIFDGLQRPLRNMKVWIEKGVSMPALDVSKKWHFKPVVKVGDRVSAGTIVGSVDENGFEHRILSPFSGMVESINEGEFTNNETCAVVSGENVKLSSMWPIRIPRPFKEKLMPSIPLITGQRIIDFLLPIAKGSSACIPGGFGTGKTVLQQTLAKWSDADVIVYIGCGERGNEMTEVLEEFPRLKDPRTGENLMKRTVLIANTSNMPVSAREASIYLGITIGEYFRDMGYHVALMADSTSRWAEAMREISGRMGELPVEEGFPAYLSARIAGVYERAGMCKTISGDIGSLSMIGAVSPPGGDFSEPVTRQTKRFTGIFWALDKALANARFYPAINLFSSYSAYVKSVNKWWDERFKDYDSLRAWMVNVLQENQKLQKIVKLLGKASLPEDKKLTVETAYVVEEAFLKQNAFDSVDAYSSPEKQVLMARVIRTLYESWLSAFKRDIPVSILTSQRIVEDVLRMGSTLKDEDSFNELIDNIKKTYEKLMESYT